jgi:hypothetical protein
MPVRVASQNNKVAGIVTGVVLLAVAAAIITYTYWPRGTRGTASGAFYSNDDGKSYFTDTIYHFPPFQLDGKDVYGAFVFTGNSGKFVGLLFRFTPQAKKTLEDSYAKTESGAQPLTEFRELLASVMRSGVEYKLPGDNQSWSPAQPHVKSPDGGDCFMVMP